MIETKKIYLDTFGVTEGQLQTLVETAMATGGSYADLFFENTSYSDLMLRDGEVTSGGFHIDYGVGIRVLKGERTGYAYSESTGMAAMLSAARAASAISRGDRPADGSIADSKGYVPRLYRGAPNPAADRYPMEKDWRIAEAAQFDFGAVRLGIGKFAGPGRNRQQQGSGEAESKQCNEYLFHCLLFFEDDAAALAVRKPDLGAVLADEGQRPGAAEL